MGKDLSILPRKDTQWSVTLRYSFDEDFKDWMKQFPGCEYNGRGGWSCPIDLLGVIRAEANRRGFSVFDYTRDLPEEREPGRVTWAPSVSGFAPYPFQARDAQRMADAPSFLLNYEMGLGKTPTSLLALRWKGGTTSKSYSALVLGPAMAAEIWEDELEEWLRGVPYHRCQPTAKKRWRFKSGTMNFLSYDLLKRVMEEGLAMPDWDVVIMDEIHYLQNPAAYRTQAVVRLLQRYSKAQRWGLTGTLITNQPDSAFTPLSILFPGRFGDFDSINHFKYRYMDNTPGKYGLAFHGANKANAEEFKRRMQFFGSRVTKPEVAHLLPDFLGPFAVYADGKPRDRAAIEWVAGDGGAISQGLKKIVVHTYGRGMASSLVEALGRNSRAKNWPVYSLTGDSTPSVRAATLKAARAADRCVVVATISATKVALDFTFAHAVLYAELSDNLEEMMQSLGRYQRLSGKHPVSSYFLLRDRNDEKARRMLKKVNAIKKLQKQGLTEQRMSEALVDVKETIQLTDDEVREMARLAAASFVGGAMDVED